MCGIISLGPSDSSFQSSGGSGLMIPKCSHRVRPFSSVSFLARLTAPCFLLADTRVVFTIVGPVFSVFLGGGQFWARVPHSWKQASLSIAYIPPFPHHPINDLNIE